MSDSTKDKINEVFPPEITEVFVVHMGGSRDENGNEVITRPVCTRLTHEDAQEVAQVLNEIHLPLLMTHRAASHYFKKCKGGAEELKQVVTNPDVIAEWNEFIKRHPISCYTVSHLKLSNEEDVKTFNEELNK